MPEDPILDHLNNEIEHIWDVAHSFGLDPYPTYFEMVPAAIMYEFGSYGLPGRFSHWTHGKAYYRMKSSYDFGLSKIYELVINTNPSYAFLMEQNDVLQNKLVAAHVLGHTDFFKNNWYFKNTSKNMIDKVSVNADRIRKYEFEHGKLEVEQFLDAALSIQEHIDYSLFSRNKEPEPEKKNAKTKKESPYADLWGMEKKKEPEPPVARVKKFPEEPVKDILLFLAEHAPDLEDWQRDCLLIVREEMLYFIPQMQTKIMNEGWASFWHSRIMRELELSDSEYTQFAQMHSNVLAPNRMQVNPYLLGYKIFENIESTWDNPTDEQKKKGAKSGQGRAKIFEVREIENDASFLRNYLTKELIEDMDLYTYRKEGDQWVVAEKNWEKVRDSIVASMTNFGNPYLVIEDADYQKRTELFIRHRHEGQDLDLIYAEKTLEHVYTLWGRPVHLGTNWDGRELTMTYDGERISKNYLDEKNSSGK